jgi:flagellin
MEINSFSRVITQDFSKSPANLPIAEKMTSQATGIEKGTNNAEDAINLLNTAEGTLNNVSESLNRMKELAINAKNGILTDDDRSIIQDEINSLRNGISDSLRNTEFNRIELFNGFEGHVQTGPNQGQGRMMQIDNTSLDTLGIKNFDVTTDFNIEDIDNAIDKVNKSRTDIGSQENALKNRVQVNNITRENVLSAQSKLDEDFEEKVMELKKNSIIEQYSIQMQRNKMDNLNNNSGLLNNMF